MIAVLRSVFPVRTLLIAPLVLAACATQVTEGPATDSSGMAITFQRKSLLPTDGGRLVAPSDLVPGDILLSAAPGMNSFGIRLLTTSPVSHAALYVGNGEVAEAIGTGVQLRRIQTMIADESVIAAFRHPALDDASALRVARFARDAVGKQYDFVGVTLQAPFALQRRVCELPGVPTVLRQNCLSTLATLQLIHGSDDRFFCSQLVLESYRAVGLPLTSARTHWVSPEDIMHMRAGDVSSVPVEQPLLYVGHLKFTQAALDLPAISIPLPAMAPREAQTR